MLFSHLLSFENGERISLSIVKTKSMDSFAFTVQEII